jgi:acylphosphatase
VRIARRFLISGRVQGVGFRFFAREAAQVENLSGWVRNLPDGRVEVRADGDRESVDRFERRLRRGPAGARVEGVDVLDDVPAGTTGEFVVRSSSHD